MRIKKKDILVHGLLKRGIYLKNVFQIQIGKLRKNITTFFPNDDFGQNWYPLDQLSNIIDEKLKKY